MKRSILVLTAAVVLWMPFPSGSAAGPEQRISTQELSDRIRGGWAGQMIGVSFGAPTEFRYLGEIIPEDKLPPWTPDRVSNSLNQDDLYVDMTFAKVLEDKGLDATTEDFAAMFREAKYRLWHANLAARRALRRGVPPGQTGLPRHNAHANDIDFQIEADFVGLICPGMPQASNNLCDRAGRVMNYGDGIYGGMFVSGMYAAAFFEKDPRKVVEAGLATLPPASPYAQVIRDLLDWHREQPADWQAVWKKLAEKWDRRDPCPDGALRPFNIDAKLNGAYVALGLLYGDGDWEKTLLVSTRAGQDSDCNPASALGILGVMRGYGAIPEKWKSGIPAIAQKKFSYTDYTFETIAETSQRQAIAMAKRNGGRLEGDTLVIQVQPPKSARLEVWDDYGSPVESLSIDDPRWRFSGEWVRYDDSRRDGPVPRKVSSTRGASATITFQGTGVIVVGPYLPNGGKIEVFLDNQSAGILDVYSDEDQSKRGESVFHRFGLANKPHKLNLVVLGQPGPGSRGNEVAVERLVVFRP